MRLGLGLNIKTSGGEFTPANLGGLQAWFQNDIDILEWPFLNIIDENDIEYTIMLVIRSKEAYKATYYLNNFSKNLEEL